MSDQPHRRTQTNPQSIPLRDFNNPFLQPEDESFETNTSQHRRTLSERGRALFNRSSRYGPRSGAYSPIQGDSYPNQGAETSNSTLRAVRTSGEYQDVTLSPALDGAAFQSAIGFAGGFPTLSFERSDLHAHTGSYDLPSGRDGVNNLVGHDDSDASDFDDGTRNVAPPSDHSDRTPLTDQRYIQPMANTPSPSGGQGRLSSQSVRFDVPITPQRNRSGNRLGDELAMAEAGSQHGSPSPSRSRAHSTAYSGSLSPLSPDSRLHRASSMVRKMSQRVVNIGNEPEIVHQELRQRRSIRNSEGSGHRTPEQERRSGLSVDGTHSPREKPSFEASTQPMAETEDTEPETPAPATHIDWVKQANPLRGRSLGIFPADSPIRTKLCDFLTNSFLEPVILILILLQTILLAVDAAPSLYDEQSNNPNYDPRQFGHSWTDYAILGLFCIYTAEIICHVIVSGFILNPEEYSTINRSQGWRIALRGRADHLFALHRHDSVKENTTHKPMGQEQPSIVRQFTMQPLLPGSVDSSVLHDSKHQKRVRLAHRAFLRHSFNRLDFLAVVSFWLSMILNVIGYESTHHFGLFRMLSALRILRLLSLTSGTSVILRSLKKAAPLLLNVALLIGFFWLLFAIIGVQSFKASLRRGCVWVDTSLDNPQNFTANAGSGSFQFCGGQLDNVTGDPTPWVYADGSSSNVIKGYLCPQGSFCVEGSNPYNGTVSFDNIANSLEMVFVIITSNTYTDIMYYLTNSEYLAAAIYFACGIVVLTFWLMNLLIAVITSSFAVIREESKSSAFAAHELVDLDDADDENAFAKRKPAIKRWYSKTKWLWIATITYGIICQCLRSAYMSESREQFIDVSETIVTLVLLLEIVFRFASDWRNFHKSKRNLFDLFLAIVTAVMQIPPIHNSGTPYNWLTIFQILRIYRVVLAVRMTRELVFLVLGSASGLLNLILFVFLLTFLVSVLAVQLFRGDIPSSSEANVNFSDIFNSFLGMYQIFSSENWTTILYNITSNNVQWNTAWIGAMFCILWFILGFFIVLNMFIAVIQENFDVSEDEKRFQQVKAFLQQRDLGGSSNGTLSLSTLFRLGRLGQRRQDPLNYGPAMMEMLLKDAVVRDFLDDEGAHQQQQQQQEQSAPAPQQPRHGFFHSVWEEVKTRVWDAEPNPFYSHFKLGDATDEADPRKLAREVVSQADRRKREQRDYLVRHPNYNVSLFLFKPDNRLRRLCMKIVGPGRGTDRIEGPAPEPFVWYAFSAILYAAIVAMVILACITTPLYQREHFASHKNWFVYADLIFSIVFTVEALIRVIADGLFWTPHAYFRSSWGLIDAVVLITLWINVVTSLLNEGYVSRAVGAFKALRALRLLNISDSARDTFHAVIIRGGWKVLSASVVSLSLLIPFAIYGVNLFNGQLVSCNDTGSNIDYLANCVGEYSNTVFAWDVLQPRVASNPWYDFDNFGDSLLILFSIVSQEGWIDVMWKSMSITGFFTQPSGSSNRGNAVFFVVFNLLGAVFVLTLFVSVFMRNYTEQTGVAYLTTDQRSWLELRKLLRQVAPSKRPSSTQKRATWQKWCYDRAIQKSGYWQRSMTIVLLFHLIVLCSESYPEPDAWSRARDWVFLLLLVIHLANIFIRLVGLSWKRFRKSAWDVYATLAVSGAFVTTLLALGEHYNRIYEQIHKLFLVSVVLLLIPRNNQLDQLFKTAAASLTAIANLLATWFVMFLVFAIALTQTFGLTAFGQNETNNINVRNVPKALILLFRCSTGEGWNQIMEDFAGVNPPFCTVGDGFLYGDCGSTEWARALFIMWNILSMYIFVNMFVSLIYESFSYVYQRASGLSKISRRDIRRFKQAWAEFDPDGKGYISKESVPRLLGELSGVFEMRIYPQSHTIGSLIERCRVPDKRTSALGDHEPSKEIDIDKLNAALRELPVKEVQERRTRLNVFYEEIMVSADPDKGIAFNTMLMILAHYKVINDNKSLRLEEFLRRRARLQRVEEAVRRGIVINFFDTLYWVRRFKKRMRSREDGRMTAVPSLQVPEILIEGEDPPETKRDSLRHSRPTLSLQIPEFGSPAHSRRASGDDERSSTGGNRDGRTLSASARDSRQNSLSPGRGPSRGSRESLGRWKSVHDHRSGEDSPHASEDGGSRDHSRSASAVSAQEVMEVLDNSAWGESIRRSFTIKRGQTKRGSK